MRIERLPQLTDNYAWLLRGEDARECAVVDPAEGRAVHERITREGLALRWILATHHHADHVGGISELLSLSGEGVEVFCSDYDLKRGRVPGATRGVADGERIVVAGETAACLHVPGHTLGAVAYHFPGARAVFTGDTLFTAGCGRLFEGTAEIMFKSLERLKSLPPETGVFCGHEYTEKNMRFSESVFPGDPAVSRRLRETIEARRAWKPTVPAPLSVELETNPFLRAESPLAFAERRRRRDSF